MTTITLIEHDGRMYREVNRNAGVGEVIKVVSLGGEFSDYPIGTIGTVTKVDNSDNSVLVKKDDLKGALWVSNGTYVTLEKIDYTLIGLIERVSKLEARVDALEANDAEVDEFIPVQQPEQPVVTRESVIAQATQDVEQLLSRNYPNKEGFIPSVWFVTDGGRFVVTHKCEFIENREKRTVVALIKGVHDGVVSRKGIARCAPDDCFNVHIGKAIALRKALGLEIPEEYVHAPQPTEANVGDIVRVTGNDEANACGRHYWNIGDMASVERLADADEAGARRLRKLNSVYYQTISARNFLVVDDSHDFGGNPQ